MMNEEGNSGNPDPSDGCLNHHYLQGARLPPGFFFLESLY
jgi:hypothetical protein